MQQYETDARAKKHYLEYEACYRELTDCSFAPSLNVAKGRSFQEYRTADEFYTDQIKYVDKRDRKITECRKEHEAINQSLCDFVPKLDKNSARMVRNKGHRLQLYSSSKHFRSDSEDSRMPMQEINVNCSFHPAINSRSKNLRRNTTVGAILYNDAKRRAVSISKKREENEKMFVSYHRDSHVLGKSEDYLVERFSAEFDREFEKVAKGGEILSYLKTAEFLAILGFACGGDNKGSTELGKVSSRLQKVLGNLTATPTPQKCSGEGVLLYDMWQLLHGEDFGGVSRRNIKAFLLAVLGLHQPWMEDGRSDGISLRNGTLKNCWNDLPSGVSAIPEKDETDKNDELPPSQEQPHGHFPENSQDYCIRKEDVVNIHNYFMPFYQNKVLKKQSPKKVEEQRPSFKPEICRTSRDLAVNYVNKSLNQMAVALDKPIYPSEVKHSDLLCFKGIEYQNKQGRERQKQRLEQEHSFTFAPKINEYKDSGRKCLKQFEKFWKTSKDTRNGATEKGTTAGTEEKSKIVVKEEVKSAKPKAKRSPPARKVNNPGLTRKPDEEKLIKRLSSGREVSGSLIYRNRKRRCVRSY